MISKLLGGRASADIIASTIDTPVREVIALLAGQRIGAVPILEQGKVVGIFSERDVIYRLAAEGDDCLARPVGEVMTSPPITVDLGTSILDALALMTRRRIRHLPVMEGDQLRGFVSIGDLVKARLEAIQHEAEAMREYIQMA